MNPRIGAGLGHNFKNMKKCQNLKRTRIPDSITLSWPDRRGQIEFLGSTLLQFIRKFRKFKKK